MATQGATTVDVERIELLADAIRRVPRTLAQRHDILPLFAEDDQLMVAIPDPSDKDVLDRLRLATGLRVEAFPASRDLIRSRLREAYPLEQSGKSDEAPAVRTLDEIHSLAIAGGASDIHLEPLAAGGRVRLRVDGILQPLRGCPGELFAQLVSRVKLLGGMDIADRRQPQDGRYVIEVKGRTVEARVSSMPTIAGEKIVIRLLDHESTVRALADLGMPELYLKQFMRAVHAPHGFVIVCGPTGSGKTTTLYAALAERNLDSDNVCTVEDPIEVRIAGLRDNETIVLGGLLRDIDSQTVTKVPWLADIPVFGKIFQNRQRTRERDEVVFLITPHVIYPNGPVPSR